MSNTVNLLNGLEHLYPDNTVISQMKRTLHAYPECESAMVDAFSLGQLKSNVIHFAWTYAVWHNNGLHYKVNKDYEK